MSYISNILNRTTLQEVATHIYHDASVTKIIRVPLEVREEKAYEQLQKELESVLEETLLQKVNRAINDYVSEHGDLQFTLGMKAGARLINQLMVSENDY